MLVIMQSNGMRLLKLINDLLDLVRLESGVMQVRREPLAVSEFIKGLASAARQMAEDKRLRLETHVDPAIGTILADRDKLEKIILNLQFNALKFTPAGGRVELRAEKQGEEVLFSVQDTGMGISEKNLPFVFDRFWQADGSSKRKFQGVGIGLALVKELAEVQGGKVSVASQEGKGTTFTVRLPYLKADAAAQSKIEEAPETAVPAPASNLPARFRLTNGFQVCIAAPNSSPPLRRCTKLCGPLRPRQTAPVPSCWSPMTSRTCCTFLNPSSPRTTRCSKPWTASRPSKKPASSCQTSSCWT